ncbi:hypothetical protein ACLI1A_10280 [Flavobacterium sp. RHBU_3]|uniref:hypothetical protein n=1 Tax=Flavobacterium sp. RHBU_3 TaxID=3391184 RepID=UPI003984AC95
MPQQFNIDDEFKKYLHRAGLNPEVMDAIQLRERKMVFMAGITHLLKYTLELGDEDVPEEIGMACLDNIWNQVNEYWSNLNKPQQ